MKVRIKVEYTWTEEVSDDDLIDLCEGLNMTPDDKGVFDEDQLDQAFLQWQENKEDAIIQDPSNIADDATCDINIETVHTSP